MARTRSNFVKQTCPLRVQNGLFTVILIFSVLKLVSNAWHFLGNVTVNENATLNVSSLNHLDVKELLNSIWLKGSNVNFTHKQIFKDLIINGTLTEVN